MPRKQNKIERSRVALLAALYGGLFFLLYFVSFRHAVLPELALDIIDPKASSFRNLPIQAKAVYVLDSKLEKEIYSVNGDVPLPFASIAKIMTAVCALDALGRDGRVLIEKGDVDPLGRLVLRAGESWKAKDLVSYMLVESSNDAARALARAAGGEPSIVSCMNKRADELGLYDTKFANGTGLDIADSPGAYGSAHDATRLLYRAMILYPDIFEKTGKESYNMMSDSGREYKVKNTDRVTGEIMGFVASKTGLTDLAGGNLVYAMNVGLGHVIIVAILGSTEEGRFADAILLSNAIIQNLGNTQI